jgi:predicted regulator of Ras-like GTPase activity (Roadblock/LC7/MglB family)
MASRTRLWVSPDGSLWKVHYEEGQVISRHPTQAAAMSQARATVKTLGAGSISQIMIQRPDGRIRLEWTYGKDPFPPVG